MLVSFEVGPAQIAFKIVPLQHSFDYCVRKYSSKRVRFGLPLAKGGYQVGRKQTGYSKNPSIQQARRRLA